MELLISSSVFGSSTVLFIKETVEAMGRFNASICCPPLYSSGVTYATETGTELLLDWVHCLAKGTGDCASLAAWRLGELLRQGEKASISIEVKEREEADYLHVRIRRNDGSIEDPSRKLGMP